MAAREKNCGHCFDAAGGGRGGSWHASPPVADSHHRRPPRTPAAPHTSAAATTATAVYAGPLFAETACRGGDERPPGDGVAAVAAVGEASLSGAGSWSAPWKRPVRNTPRREREKGDAAAAGQTGARPTTTRLIMSGGCNHKHHGRRRRRSHASLVQSGKNETTRPRRCLFRSVIQRRVHVFGDGSVAWVGHASDQQEKQKNTRHAYSAKDRTEDWGTTLGVKSESRAGNCKNDGVL